MFVILSKAKYPLRAGAHTGTTTGSFTPVILSEARSAESKDPWISLAEAITLKPRVAL